MLNYPNYYQNTMPMYPNYNPIANAQQRLQQMEQQYPQFAPQNQYQMPGSPQIVGLNGKIVDDFGVITANDVPMDGNGAVFIKRDGSEIQLRNWTANGTIQTIVFKPISEPQNSQVGISLTEAEKIKIGLSDEVTGAFMSRFDDIASRIEKLEKSMSGSKAMVSRAKKEADAE